jgi:hypothetical protein
MQSLAIISHLLHYALAVAGVYFCITLFRQRRVFGWLLLSAVFLEPLVLLVMRVFRGRSLLPYKTTALGPDGIAEVSYRMNLPFFYILAVVGLFMLVRESRKKMAG